jgi:hypothetical protein
MIQAALTASPCFLFVIAGLDPAIQAKARRGADCLDARVNPRVKSGDAHDEFPRRLNDLNASEH